MFFNSLSLSVKPIFFPLGKNTGQGALLFFPKPATPSQKLLSTGVSTVACAKLPSNVKTQRHFVLVHGASHGAWCWYKVATLLKSAGHQVTALDMAASGVHPRQVDELRAISDYFEPLMEFMTSLLPEERVILVGHSLAGLGISVAMESFPEKISSAVFAAAIMPGPDLSFTTVREECARQSGSSMETQHRFDNRHNNPPTSLSLGPEYISTKLYQRSPTEDLTLARLLLRPHSLFSDDATQEKVGLTKEKYGSIPRAYIVCDQDNVTKEAVQRWMIQNNPPDEVKVVPGSDHMLMFSKPQEMCSCLEQIAEKYF